MSAAMTVESKAAMMAGELDDQKVDQTVDAKVDKKVAMKVALTAVRTVDTRVAWLDAMKVALTAARTAVLRAHGTAVRWAEWRGLPMVGWKAARSVGPTADNSVCE